MLSFNTHLFKTKYFLLAAFVILISLSFVLPVEAGYENHFYENLQLVILFAGLVNVLYKSRKFIDFRKFYLGCGIFYIIMMARELSWGRVFYPIGVRNNGEDIYVSIHQIWYGEAVYPAVTVLVLIALLLIFQSYLYCRRRRIIMEFPLLYLIFFFVLMATSQLVFEKELFDVLMPYNQLLEEAAEAVAYCSLVCFTHNWTFNLTKKKEYFYVEFL